MEMLKCTNAKSLAKGKTKSSQSALTAPNCLRTSGQRGLQCSVHFFYLSKSLTAQFCTWVAPHHFLSHTFSLWISNGY